MTRETFYRKITTLLTVYVKLKKYDVALCILSKDTILNKSVTTTKPEE